eukprot:6304866-Amphidinium_carterae.2
MSIDAHATAARPTTSTPRHPCVQTGKICELCLLPRCVASSKVADTPQHHPVRRCSKVAVPLPMRQLHIGRVQSRLRGWTPPSKSPSLSLVASLFRPSGTS